MKTKINPLDDELVVAAGHGDVESVKSLLALGGNPCAHESRALRHAALQNALDCVKILAPLNAGVKKESLAQLFECLAGHGKHESLAMILPLVDPKAKNSAALRRAAKEGHVECVGILLPVSDPLATGERRDARKEARKNGHGDVVAMIDSFMEAQSLGASISEPKRETPKRRRAL